MSNDTKRQTAVITGAASGFGLEASRMIRQSSKQNARTPILAITANVSPNEIEECRQAGMQDHVSKPIRAAELIQKVSTWIDTEI